MSTNSKDEGLGSGITVLERSSWESGSDTIKEPKAKEITDSMFVVFILRY